MRGFISNPSCSRRNQLPTSAFVTRLPKLHVTRVHNRSCEPRHWTASIDGCVRLVVWRHGQRTENLAWRCIKLHRFICGESYKFAGKVAVSGHGLLSSQLRTANCEWYFELTSLSLFVLRLLYQVVLLVASRIGDDG